MHAFVHFTLEVRPHLRLRRSICSQTGRGPSCSGWCRWAGRPPTPRRVRPAAARPPSGLLVLLLPSTVEAEAEAPLDAAGPVLGIMLPSPREKPLKSALRRDCWWKAGDISVERRSGPIAN